MAHEIIELRQWYFGLVGKNRDQKAAYGLPTGHPSIEDGELMCTGALQVINFRRLKSDLRYFKLVGPPDPAWVKRLTEEGLHYDPQAPAFPKTLH